MQQTTTDIVTAAEESAAKERTFSINFLDGTLLNDKKPTVTVAATFKIAKIISQFREMDPDSHYKTIQLFVAEQEDALSERESVTTISAEVDDLFMLFSDAPRDYIIADKGDCLSVIEHLLHQPDSVGRVSFADKNLVSFADKNLADSAYGKLVREIYKWTDVLRTSGLEYAIDSMSYPSINVDIINVLIETINSNGDGLPISTCNKLLQWYMLWIGPAWQEDLRSFSHTGVSIDTTRRIPVDATDFFELIKTKLQNNFFSTSRLFAALSKNTELVEIFYKPNEQEYFDLLQKMHLRERIMDDNAGDMLLKYLKAMVRVDDKSEECGEKYWCWSLLRSASVLLTYKGEASNKQLHWLSAVLSNVITRYNIEGQQNVLEFLKVVFYSHNKNLSVMLTYNGGDLLRNIVLGKNDQLINIALQAAANQDNLEPINILTSAMEKNGYINQFVLSAESKTAIEEFSGRVVGFADSENSRYTEKDKHMIDQVWSKLIVAEQGASSMAKPSSSDAKAQIEDKPENLTGGADLFQRAGLGGSGGGVDEKTEISKLSVIVKANYFGS